MTDLFSSYLNEIILKNQLFLGEFSRVFFVEVSDQNFNF